jgi:hypothetical protein
MWAWCRDLVGDIVRMLALAGGMVRRHLVSGGRHERTLRACGLALSLLTIGLTIIVVAYVPLDFMPDIPPYEVEVPVVGLPLDQPVREMPARFPARTHKPNSGEGHASGSIGTVPFDPDADLVRIEDDRAWWESENDKHDTEDDHLFHRAMEEPMLRLIELVAQKGATLKVQDAYRAEGVHAARSLHKQGRAVDLTARDLSLEELAKLCWAAGFDWVYYEAPRRGGAHIHASVRADGREGE